MSDNIIIYFIYFNASTIALNSLSPLNRDKENDNNISISFLQSSNNKIKSFKWTLFDNNVSNSPNTSDNFCRSIDEIFISYSLPSFIYLLYSLCALIFVSSKNLSSTDTDSYVSRPINVGSSGTIISDEGILDGNVKSLYQFHL